MTRSKVTCTILPFFLSCNFGAMTRISCGTGLRCRLEIYMTRSKVPFHQKLPPPLAIFGAMTRIVVTPSPSTIRK